MITRPTKAKPNAINRIVENLFFFNFAPFQNFGLYILLE
jgi:hypothetical protein